jgi:glycosyltransferase involved in cell wall biosynthesis
MYICHNVLPHESQPWDSWLARLAWQWGTQFIVQSTEEKKRLLDLMPDTHVDVVSHPVYDMFADQRMTQEKARQELGLSLDVPVLLFFGIIREYKGLEDLLNALPKIRTQLKEVILIVAGEFWEDKPSYQMMIDKLGIADSVILDDRYIPNEEVPVYFSAADVLVAPYRRVTGSGVMQMALGCKCPVITTQAGNSANVVQSGINGLVTPTADSQAIGRAIIQYFRDGISRPDTDEKTKNLPQWETLVLSIESLDMVCE